VPVGHKDHGGVPVAVAVALGGFHKRLNLGWGEVFAGPQFAIGEPSGRNCSIYGSWGDQLQVRFGHSFCPHRAVDCSYKDHFINSVKKGGQEIAAVSGLTRYPSRRSNSGSLAKLTAIPGH